MRTTIIPAQITTVEDKIAGSLNMTQILILMVPVLWTAIVYIIFFPVMKLAPYKFALVFLSLVICLTLALRIKEKIVAEWLGVLFQYRLRPKYYLFNKNNLTNRELVIPELPVEYAPAKKVAKKSTQANDIDLAMSDLVKLEQLVASGKVALRYQFNKKAYDKHI
jgi:glucan phosphoethanolaminetransferase (alkaline phosphatase superfamily)